MSVRLQRVLAVLVALAILVAGLAYTAKRHSSYESDASLVLSPTLAARKDPNVLANLLSSFQSSGSSGTFVEMISSQDTLRQAHVSGVNLTVRAVPDTRTITVSTTGPSNLVTPALNAIISAAIARQGTAGDVWQLQVIASPSAASPTGTSKKLLIAATIVLAALGALFVLAVLRRTPAGAGAATGTDLAVARGLEPMPLPGPSSPRHVLASEADITFHLEGFRYIPASTTTVLFQIAGYWRSAVPQALDDPVLLLYTRYVVHALPSVASPDKRKPVAGPDTPLWRESYSAPAEVFYRHQRLALRASPDVVVGLPDPVEHRILSGGERDVAALDAQSPLRHEPPELSRGGAISARQAARDLDDTAGGAGANGAGDANGVGEPHAAAPPGDGETDPGDGRGGGPQRPIRR